MLANTAVANLSGTNSGNETTSTLGATINGAVAAAPNDADLVTTVDALVVKKITWTNVKAFLKTYFDTLYITATSISTLTNKTITALILSAGGSGAGTAPITLTSGSLLTTPEAGTLEYDGNVVYINQTANNRGVSAPVLFANLVANYTATNGTAVQKVFNSPANGQIALDANKTYRIRMMVRIVHGTGNSTKGIGLTYSGAGTISYQTTLCSVATNAAATASTFIHGDTFAAIASGNTNATATVFTYEATVRTTTAGNLQPVFQISVAQNPVVQAGSFVEVCQIGSNGVSSVGNWS
jgi:hypothetical protein